MIQIQYLLTWTLFMYPCDGKPYQQGYPGVEGQAIFSSTSNAKAFSEELLDITEPDCVIGADFSLSKYEHHPIEDWKVENYRSLKKKKDSPASTGRGERE